MYTSVGSYKRTKKCYDLMTALAFACAIHRERGFTNSTGLGYSSLTGRVNYDNRNLLLNNLRNYDNDPNFKIASDKLVELTDEDYDQAKKVYDFFDQEVIMAQLSDDFVNVHSTGYRNDFKVHLKRIFDNGTCDVKKEMAIVASLPNSLEISEKREQMQEFYNTYRSNGYVGTVNKRANVTGTIQDIKNIPRFKAKLVTVLTDQDKIVKFMYSQNNRVMDNLLRQCEADNKITMSCHIKKHNVNGHTGCQETNVNRIEIL